MGALKAAGRLDRSAALRLASGVILLVGLGCAAAIYLAAAPPAGSLEDELMQTKQYQRDVEVYGGKANLLASDLRNWLASLWHGRRLGITVGVLTLLLSAGFRYAAIPLPPPAGAPPAGDNTGGAGSAGGAPPA